MGNIEACRIKAIEIYNELKNRELKDFIFLAPETKHHCFRINFPKEHYLEQISISVPHDDCGNRGNEYNEGIPSTYEIALIKNDDIYYDDEIGYDSVCRFFSVDEIVDEINRLRYETLSPDCITNDICDQIIDFFPKDIISIIKIF